MEALNGILGEAARKPRGLISHGGEQPFVEYCSTLRDDLRADETDRTDSRCLNITLSAVPH